MGNLGAKITGIGKNMSNRIGGSAEKTLQNSNRAQKFANAVDSKVPFKTIRANAATREGQRRAREKWVNRRGSKEGAEEYVKAAAAAEDAKAYDEEVEQQRTLMQSSVEDGGGIVMENGEKRAYTLENMRDRMRELEEKSRTQDLTEKEHKQMAALTREMAGRSGGASMINGIIRDAGEEIRDASGNVTGHRLNSNFMAAMGQIYSQDATVRGKMSEKGVAMGAYMEGFMPGGHSLGAGGQQYADWAATEVRDEHGNVIGTNAQQAVRERVNSYAAGLDQGGEALNEYIDGLNAADCQAIYDQGAESVLQGEDLERFKTRAESLGVTGKSTQAVALEAGQAQALSDISAHTGQTASNTGEIAGNTEQIVTHTGQMAGDVSSMSEGVLQIRDHTDHISATSGMVDVGYVKDRDGNLHHVRQTGDGRYIDDQGRDMGQIDPTRVRRR